MRIVSIHERAISLRSEMRNAWISFAEMDTSIVAVVTDVVRDGSKVVGFGFNSNGRYAASGIMRARMIPRLLDANPAELLDSAGENFEPEAMWDVMMRNEKPGGHGERSVAVGALDMAIFDLIAKIDEKPLCRLLAERYGDGNADESVFVYAAGGYYYPNGSVTRLREEMGRYLNLGYTTVKMKIGGTTLAEDLRRLEAVIDVTGDGSRVAVDANGRFDLETALAYGQALEPYGVFWYEEPGDPLDYELHARLSEAYPNSLATGENLFSMQDARNLLRYGGLRPDRDYLQIDPALSYGLVEYLRILAMFRERGWSTRQFVPHGGHQFALHIAAGLHLGGNESYPGVFEPIGGFADDARVSGGHIHLESDYGIGIEKKTTLFREFKELLA